MKYDTHFLNISYKICLQEELIHSSCKHSCFWATSFEGKINESFPLENVLNMTHGYDNFNKKIFAKIVIQKLMCQVDAFSSQNGSFIFPSKGGIEKQNC